MRNYPAKLKVFWALTILSILFAVYLIYLTPDDINDERIIIRSGLIEDVHCNKGRRSYSKKYVYVSSNDFVTFDFRIKGECNEIIKKFTNKYIQAYGVKPLFLSEGFSTLSVFIESKEVVSMQKSIADHEGAVVMFLIICPLIVSSCMTGGYHQGKWS